MTTTYDHCSQRVLASLNKAMMEIPLAADKNDKTYAFSEKTGVIEITKDQSIVDPLPFLKNKMTMFS